MTLARSLKILLTAVFMVVSGCCAQSLKDARELVDNLERERLELIKAREALPRGRAAAAADKAMYRDYQSKIAAINDKLPAARKARREAERAAGYGK